MVHWWQCVASEAAGAAHWREETSPAAAVCVHCLGTCGDGGKKGAMGARAQSKALSWEVREEGREGDDVMTLHSTYTLLKTQVLRAWQRFVSLSCEEKMRKVWKAKLRRKVAQWQWTINHRLIFWFEKMQCFNSIVAAFINYYTSFCMLSQWWRHLQCKWNIANRLTLLLICCSSWDT